MQVRDGRVMVLEAVQRVSFFDLNGNFIKSLSPKGRWIMLAGMDSGGNIIATEGYLIPENPHYKLIKFNPEMTAAQEIATATAPDNFRGLDPFMSISRWQITPRDEIIYSRPANYTLEYYDQGGKLFKKLYQDYDPVKVSEEEKEEFRKETERNGRRD